jgi:hypothetical protein
MESEPDGRSEVFARVNFLQTTSERIADVATAVRDVVHPGIREEPGYVGYVVLGDRETGKALGVTLWQSEADRERSNEKARKIRPRVEQATGGTMQSVESYDVLFFDVPQS